MTDRNLTKLTPGASGYTHEGMYFEAPPSGFSWNRTVPAVVDPFAESATQLYPLGTKLVHGGRTFRYAKAGGTAIEVSALCQAVVPLAGHINEDMGTAAVGGTTVTFTPNTVTTDDIAANGLQDGWLVIYDAAGEGHMYQVLSHPALTGGTAGTLTLVDPIRVATVALTSKATVIYNPYRAVIIHPSPPTAVPVGVTVAAVTADYFFWLQTAGPTAILIDGTVVLGKQVRPSEDDDGAVAALTYDEGTSSSNSDYGPVGWVMDIGADAAGGAATYGAIKLVGLEG